MVAIVVVDMKRMMGERVENEGEEVFFSDKVVFVLF